MASGTKCVEKAGKVSPRIRDQGGKLNGAEARSTADFSGTLEAHPPPDSFRR